jgi:hypothetical protein
MPHVARWKMKLLDQRVQTLDAVDKAVFIKCHHHHYRLQELDLILPSICWSTSFLTFLQDDSETASEEIDTCNL